MANNTLVTVIITTYNRAKLLEKTLDSVRNQTYKNLEIIIVSDSSNDGTDIYIQNISDVRIKYFKLDKNSGLPAVTRNHGLKNSLGEFIAFCDDDDIWINTKIEKQLDYIKNYDLCFTKRGFINENGFNISHRPIYIPSKFNLRTLLVTNYITLSSVLVRKNILEKFKGFNESKLMKASEDYDLWLRMLAKNITFTYCQEELVFYRIHLNNISNNHLAGIRRTLLINRNLFRQEKISICIIFSSYLINYLKLMIYRFISISK
jgi:teichuronic acid biosynthesis glycosyltransferase TuaG